MNALHGNYYLMNDLSTTVEAMRKEILSRLDNDVLINNDNIDVVVTGQVVHLIGTVKDVAEMKRCEEHVKKVHGPGSIHNNLYVRPHTNERN